MATAEEKEPMTGPEPGTYTLLRSFCHELLVPAANLLSLIALCSSRMCAAFQRPLRTNAWRLVLSDVVVVGSVGDQRVA